MLQQITALFIDGAEGFSEDLVGLFDDVLSRLIEEIESKARTELAIGWRRSATRRSR